MNTLVCLFSCLVLVVLLMTGGFALAQSTPLSVQQADLFVMEPPTLDHEEIWLDDDVPSPRPLNYGMPTQEKRFHPNRVEHQSAPRHAGGVGSQPVTEALPALVNLKPLDTVVVVPVLPYRDQKAFGDIALLVGDELSAELGAQAKQAQVLNPSQVMETWSRQGLMPLYARFVQHYLESSRPEPRLTGRLLEGLNRTMSQGHQIDRLWLVEASVDFTQQEEAASPFEKVKRYLTDSRVQHANYWIEARLQLFNPQEPNFPRMWQARNRSAVNGDRLVGLTPSVTQQLDSRLLFGDATRDLSQQSLHTAPDAAFYQVVTQTAVRAEVESN